MIYLVITIILLLSLLLYRAGQIIKKIEGLHISLIHGDEQKFAASYELKNLLNHSIKAQENIYSEIIKLNMNK